MGVYVNVQQYNKDLLRSRVADEDGRRIKCANDPNGPGLRYVGSNPHSYSGYEVNDDGGGASGVFLFGAIQHQAPFGNGVLCAGS